jgi:DNA-binding IclR family transcriptional regulator
VSAEGSNEYTIGDRILAALADAPMTSSALADELDSTGRSIGQRMRGLMTSGLVRQDAAGLWHLVRASMRSDVAAASIAAEVVDAEPAPDATDDPEVAIAVWDDGSMTINVGTQSTYLPPGAVKRMAAHMARFRP